MHEHRDTDIYIDKYLYVYIYIYREKHSLIERKKEEDERKKDDWHRPIHYASLLRLFFFWRGFPRCTELCRSGSDW